MTNNERCKAGEHKWYPKPTGDHTFCIDCDVAQDESNYERQESRYSGERKSGICICGCSWQKHHLGMIARPGYFLRKDNVYEYYIPQECDNFGFNEYGGMKFNEESEEWESHCFGYQDRGVD